MLWRIMEGWGVADNQEFIGVFTHISGHLYAGPVIVSQFRGLVKELFPVSIVMRLMFILVGSESSQLCVYILASAFLQKVGSGWNLNSWHSHQATETGCWVFGCVPCCVQVKIIVIWVTIAEKMERISHRVRHEGWGARDFLYSLTRNLGKVNFHLLYIFSGDNIRVFRLNYLRQELNHTFYSTS